MHARCMHIQKTGVWTKYHLVIQHFMDSNSPKVTGALALEAIEI